MRRSAWSLLFCILLSCSVRITGEPAGAKRPITAEDLWGVKRVGAPSMAPDGKWCVVEVTSWDIEKDDSTSELWLLSTDGKTQKQITNSGGKNIGPKWSPDGNWIAFTTKRGDDKVNQIYLISPGGGEARRLSKLPFAASGLKWGKDSKTVYCIGWTWPDAKDDEAYLKKDKERGAAKSKAMIIDDAAFRYFDHWIADGKRPFVFPVNVATGKHSYLVHHAGRWLPPYEVSEKDYDVAPDGKEICLVSENVKEIGLDANHDLFTLDLTKEDAEPTNITADNAANDISPAYSPDGTNLAFLRQHIKFFYADQTKLMLMDRKSRAARKLNPSLDRSAASPYWLPDNKRLTAEFDDRGFGRIGFVSISNPLVILESDDVTERNFSAATQERAAVFQRTTFSLPAQVWSHRPGGEPTCLDHFNDALVAEWDLGRVENRTFKGADEKDIQMFIVYPPNFDAKKKWPLVQMVHGGPHNAFHNEFGFRWHPHVWAAQGWVVAIVNFHGSSGFGQEFTDSITADLGRKPMADIMKSTEWFAAQPWIDKNRLAAAGGSYGGYMMAWLNGHTDLFKAMVCHAGVYNWHSMLASDIVKGRERSLGAMPWGDLEKIDQQTPQRFAKNFKTPTLVIHGERDFRVPVTQGLEYYNTLRQKGVPTRLIYFPDENHWVLKPKNSVQWYDEVFGWLGRWLKP